jgi:hypothetical protein
MKPKLREGSPWTQEKVAELVTLYNQHDPVLTIRGIAREMNVSINAVTGKIDRLGIANRGSANMPKNKPKAIIPKRVGKVSLPALPSLQPESFPWD